MIGLELDDMRLGQTRGRQAEFADGLLQKVSGQEGDVLLALSQWGDLDRHHVEAVKQVLPKAAGIHFLRQITVGGRNDANVYRARPLLAHPLVLALLFRRIPGFR
jgi:hypothetical protein